MGTDRLRVDYSEIVGHEVTEVRSVWGTIPHRTYEGYRYFFKLSSGLIFEVAYLPPIGIELILKKIVDQQFDNGLVEEDLKTIVGKTILDLALSDEVPSIIVVMQDLSVACIGDDIPRSDKLYIVVPGDIYYPDKMVSLVNQIQYIRNSKE